VSNLHLFIKGKLIMAVNSLAKNIVGQEFGYWKVLKKVETSKHGHRMYLCQCICGKQKTLRGSMLLQGTSISCRCQTSKLKNITHDMTNTRTYSTWSSMRSRCSNPKYAHYDRYGAIGIKVCDDWNNSFEAFFADMGERPKGMTIDRIDNSKGYYKENCRWATPKEQTLNRYPTVWLEYDGETLCLADMARKYGLTTTMIRTRLEKGMTLEQAIEIPRQKVMYEVTANNETLGMVEFCGKYRLATSSISRKKKQGFSIKDAMKYYLEQKGFFFDFEIVEKPYRFKK